MGWLTKREFMTNETVQLYVQDKILAKTLLPLIPHSVKPNYVTLLRLFLIPFNIYYVSTEQWHILLPLFAFTAFTDMVDGAMARVRKQITLWGAILDPTADKLLMASVAGIFIVQNVSFLLAFTIILMEFLIVLGAYSRRRRGEYICANGAGKVKFSLQAFGFGLMLLSMLISMPSMLYFGTLLMIISLGFAVVSLVTYGL
ncbi:MAG: CDP-alcohol phosphatidyltransferase family protein [Patescibacteria group bacterium]